MQLPKPRQQVERAEVRVSLEHCKTLMSGDGGDFHHVEALLEQPGCGLVAQIV